MNQPNCMSVEALESRQLLSGWGQQAKLIGLDRVLAQFPSLTGTGASIAIIDSGVDYNHPVLGGGYGKKVVTGYDFVDKDSDPMSSSNAHGTATAGMLGANGYDYNGAHFQGIAAGAKLIALRQNNSYGVDSALKWVIANKAKYNIVAATMVDWGGGSAATYKSIQASLATLASMKVFVTSPSGNAGAYNNVGWHDPNDNTVGATNVWGGISGFTQRGPNLDFLAPAEKVTVPYYDVSKRTHIYTSDADGTSWASPQIAGTATLLRQINPNFSNAEVTSIIRDSATWTYDSVTKISYPRLDLYKAVVLGYQRAGKPVSTPTPTPVPAPGGTQFSTPTRVAASAVIQAEDFDAGTEGTTFHDTDSGSNGGNAYRSNTGVDIITINDSSSTRAIGLVKAGEWTRYSIDVEQTGTYSLDFRVAALGTGGSFHLEVDGKNVTGALTVPNTGNWNTYTTVTKAGISIAAGKHTLKLVFDRAGSTGYVGNFNFLKLTRNVAPQTATAPTSGPYKAVNVFAGSSTIIQAEDFDLGADGLGYHDTDSANIGGKYRTTGVDIESTTDTGGGYNVGFLKAGEWLNYTVNVSTAGTFNLDARVASLWAGSAFHVEVDGKNVTGTMSIPGTGSFQSWTTIRKSGISLTTGKHTLKLVIESTGGKMYAGNINWLKLS